MIGNFAYSAQYLQNPIPPDGARVRWNWFPIFDLPFDRSYLQHIVQSWDTATSDDPGSAYSVCLTFGYYDGHWLQLDVYRRRVNFPDLRDAALRLYRQWKPDKVLVEDASSGRQLIQILKERLGVGRSKLLPISANWGKEQRLDLAAGKIEEGLIALPADAPWLESFKREILGFPNATRQDQVDALTQFVRWASLPRAKSLLNQDSPARRLRTVPRASGRGRTAPGVDLR